MTSDNKGGQSPYINKDGKSQPDNKDFVSDRKNLRVVPVTLRTANDYVMANHRHHGVATGCKFSIGAVDPSGKLVGVAIVGRPISRILDDGVTAEVTRLCTDGTKNACSFLYAAAARICKAMGYERILTYILESEEGTSLTAAGWIDEGYAGGGQWHRETRKRAVKTTAQTCLKRRFSKKLAVVT